MFAKAREKARQSSCLSNVKQLVLGILQYAQDYDETMVPGSYPMRSPNPADYNWRQVLDPYLKNTQITVCPSQSGTYGYGWNYQNFGYIPTAPMSGWASPLAQIQVPSETIIIGDNPDTGMYGAGGVFIYGPTQSSPPADGMGNVSGRHNEGGNYGFCDGHAKWLSRSTAAGSDRLWTQAAD